MVLSAAALSGCASIVGKSEYPVSINSIPAGANFVVTNKAGQKVHSGITPSSVTLKSSAGHFKGESHTIEVSKEGYSTKTYTLTSGVSGWYWGNILLGGIVGLLIVDPATGAMYKLPDHVEVPIEAKTASVNGASALTIATIDSLTEAQIAHLQKVQ